MTVGFSEAAVASAFVLCAKVIGKRAASSIAGKKGMNLLGFFDSRYENLSITHVLTRFFLSKQSELD